MQGSLHYRLDLFGGQSAATQTVRRIFRQSLRPLFRKTLAPLHNGWTTGIQSFGNSSVGQTLRRQQADMCTHDDPLGAGFGSYPSFQGFAFLFRYRQFFGWVPHEPIYNTKLGYCKDIFVT